MYEKEVARVIEEEIGQNVNNVSEIRDGTNTVFRVSCDKNKYIFKIGDFDTRSVRLEPYFLDLLIDNGVPVPEVYWRGEINGYPSFIAEYFSGTPLGYPPDISEKELVKHSRDVGRILGTIQKIERPAGEFTLSDKKLNVINGGWENLFYKLLEMFSRQAKGNFPQLGSEANRIAHKFGVPDLDGSACLCPLDLHTGNLIFSSSGDLQGVIDMERIYSAHPGLGYEINVHSLYAGNSNLEQEIRQKFDEGYSNARPTPDLHPSLKVLAVLREMRAAHIWWDDMNSRKNAMKNKLEEIESNH